MLTILFVTFLFFGTFQNGKAECETSSVTTVSGTYAPEGTICPGDLIFEDNFDEFNLEVWQHELFLGGAGNGEFEFYNNHRSNSYVEDGILHIRPTLLANATGNDFLYSGTLNINGGAPADECTDPTHNGCIRTGSEDSILNPIKSARIRTVYSFSFKYGKVDVRAKVPLGDWLWPAIWLIPRWNQYSRWPSSGEIDIMECRGNREIERNGVHMGHKQVASTLMWGPSSSTINWSDTHYPYNSEVGFNEDFHNYQMEWTPDKIQFSVDDVVIGSVEPPDGGFWEMGNLNASGLENPWKRNTKMAPFDQKFYLILNLAIGGTGGYFADDSTYENGKPWNNSSPRAMTDFWEARDQWLPTWDIEGDDSHFQVDYVKVWAL